MEKAIYLEDWTSTEITIENSQGSMQVLFVPFKDDIKRPTGVMAVIQDITKQVKLDNMTKEFVADVSHELKTPLSSMKVLSESILLQEDVPKEMYVEFLEDITSEVDRMTEIINDLLTLVKLDQKEIPITFVKAELNQIIIDITKRMKPLANAKDIELNYILLKQEVFADIDKTKFILATKQHT